MAKKEFTYRGKTFEELSKMSINELAGLFPARQRRSIKRSFTEAQKTFLKKLQRGRPAIKTQVRDAIILPEMVGKVIRIHNGKEFIPITVEKEMIGHFLGEFVLTRKKVEHSAPGIGATRSSASLSVK